MIFSFFFCSLGLWVNATGSLFCIDINLPYRISDSFLNETWADLGLVNIYWAMFSYLAYGRIEDFIKRNGKLINYILMEKSKDK